MRRIQANLKDLSLCVEIQVYCGRRVNYMSFTLEIKRELSHVETKRDCCIKAECYGAWLFTKCFTPFEASYISESGDAVRRMAELAAEVCGIMPEISYAVSRRQKPAFRVCFPDTQDRMALLESFGHSRLETVLRINYANFEESCCFQAFLRGAFLSCGIAVNPDRGYHVEYIAQHKALAKDLMVLLNRLEEIHMRPQLGERKGNSYIYIKESEQCEELLTYIGASNAAMQMMQVKMYKEVKNDINRRSNFETANMDKTYSASARQIAAIAKISDAGKLMELPEDQRLIAQMRLENPEMSLRELAEALQYSRSGINYRMKKIMAFADQLPTPVF